MSYIVEDKLIIDDIIDINENWYILFLKNNDFRIVYSDLGLKLYLHKHPNTYFEYIPIEHISYIVDLFYDYILYPDTVEVDIGNRSYQIPSLIKMEGCNETSENLLKD